MPSKRSGCRGPKLRSFFKVDHQTSRRTSLGESEISEAVAMLLRLAGFPGNVCPVGCPCRTFREDLSAPAYFLCGAFNKRHPPTLGGTQRGFPEPLPQSRSKPCS